jgi:hypothetical protein
MGQDGIVQSATLVGVIPPFDFQLFQSRTRPRGLGGWPQKPGHEH